VKFQTDLETVYLDATRWPRKGICWELGAITLLDTSVHLLGGLSGLNHWVFWLNDWKFVDYP
jgi:hypothetical protein